MTTSSPLKPTQALPKRLAADLHRRIRTGEWGPGEKLPAETALAAEYGVSRSTVRGSLQLVAEAGAVRVRQGAGTFVSQETSAVPAGLQPLRSTSALIEEHGYECEVRFRKKDLRAASQQEAGQLRRDQIPLVLSYERSFHSADLTLAFEAGVIVADMLPAGASFDSLTGSVFAFLEPLGLLPEQSLTHLSATSDADLAWGPFRPDPPLYLTLDQVQFLRSGAAISWSSTHFVQKYFRFSLMRSM